MAIINGTSGNDNLIGTTEADTINGFGGDDVINALTRIPGLVPVDVVDGGAGIDTLVVNASAEAGWVNLGFGVSPRLSVRSETGNFYVNAYNMERVLYTGSSADDSINTGDLAGTINGRGGVDHWLADLGYLSTGVSFVLGTTASIAAAGLTSITNIERLTLTTGSGNDKITSGDQADSISTGDGRDVINAGSRQAGTVPTDYVNGGDDVDTLVVNASTETDGVQLYYRLSPTYQVRSNSGNFYVDAYSVERVKFTGGAGNDYIETGAGGVTVNGKGGIDHWSADLSAVSDNISFVLGTTSSILPAGLRSVLGIERITLRTGSGNDRITGGSEADDIRTGNGDDTIDAKTRVSGAVPTDYVDGGNGNDTLVVDASAETDGVQLYSRVSPTYQVRSNSGNFYVDAYNVERVKFTGGTGNDHIETGTGGIKVDGRGGIDTWAADLSAMTSKVNFILGTTTSILDAGLTSIRRIERIYLTTGDGNDSIVGGDQADDIRTGNGNDTIDAKTRVAGSVPTDYVDGGNGTDTLVVDASAESDGVQLYSRASPTYQVRSTSGNFYVDAYNVERVKFTGGAGNDYIETGSGGVMVDGRGGIDHWNADLSAISDDIDFFVGITTSIASAGLNAITRIEQITLETGSGNDRIVGGNQADDIRTGGGDDVINAKGRVAGTVPVDYVDGGNGIDTLIVNASTETDAVQLYSGLAPTYQVRSNSGNFYVNADNVEKIRFTGGAGGDDIYTGKGGVTVDGGAGTDHWHADLSELTDAVDFVLGTTTSIAAAGLTSILNVERIDLTTGEGNDHVVGGDQADMIRTGDGNDVIDVKSRPAGFVPIDVAYGGNGTDTLVVDASSETAAVQLYAGASPTLQVRSNSGNFYADAYEMEKVNFTGGSGNDNATGLGFADIFAMGLGNDTVSGRGGNDTIAGHGGDDTITGGRGADNLSGNAGADTFNYDRLGESRVATAETDTITDFQVGTDKVDLAGIDANLFLGDGDTAFTYIGSAAFSGARGELRAVAGLAEADLNGDGAADFSISFSNGANLSVTDFIL